MLTTAGFRRVGNRMFQTEVVRTSIDRPDVSICVIPMAKGTLSSFDMLYFLLRDAMDDRVATPEKIKKTIVFIDGRKSVLDAARWAMQQLMAMSDQYGVFDLASDRCVYKVIGSYTAHVAEYDRNKLYAEFKEAASKVRIMFATTSLGMGINIPDVECVVTLNLPITKSLADLWQRIGRGGRLEGRFSQAFIFLPYYLFDSIGRNPVNMPPATVAPAPAVRSRAARNQLPSDRARLRNYKSQIASPLSQVVTPGDVSVVASQDEPLSQIDGVDAVDASPSQVDGLRVWNAAEIKARKDLSPAWLHMANGLCYRQGFLVELGEMKLPASERHPVPLMRCCSKCNLSLLPEAATPPAVKKHPGVPKKGTKAHFMYVEVEAFALERAFVLYSTPGCRFPMPSSVYMSQRLRCDLTYALMADLAGHLANADGSDDTTSVECLKARVVGVDNWEPLNEEYGVLLFALPYINARGRDAYSTHKEQAPLLRAQRAAERQRVAVSSTTSVHEGESSIAIADGRLARDDELALEVAAYEEDHPHIARSRLPVPIVVIQRAQPRPRPQQPTPRPTPAPLRVQPSRVPRPTPTPSSPRSVHRSATPATPVARRPMADVTASRLNRLRRQGSPTAGVLATPKSSRLRLSTTPSTQGRTSGRSRRLTAKGAELYGVEQDEQA